MDWNGSPSRRYLLQDVLNIYTVIAVSVIVVRRCILDLLQKSARRSPNNPDPKKEKKYTDCAGFFSVLSYVCIDMHFFADYFKKQYYYMSITLCLLFGIIWQAFTLLNTDSSYPGFQLYEIETSERLLSYSKGGDFS
jgi:hypothetical protein